MFNLNLSKSYMNVVNFVSGI